MTMKYTFVFIDVLRINIEIILHRGLYWFVLSGLRGRRKQFEAAEAAIKRVLA